MKHISLILDCLCPDDMDPDDFGELMLCRIEAAEGIAMNEDGDLILVDAGSAGEQIVDVGVGELTE